MGDTLRRTISEKSGMNPGSLIYVGNLEESPTETKITLIDYDEKNHQEKVLQKIEDAFPFKNEPTITWINIDGIMDVEVIQKIGDHFGIHPLVLEDVLNTHQRPKMEDFENYLYVVLKIFLYDKENHTLEYDQISVILGKNFVITFQEKECKLFDSLKERIRNSKGKIRKSGSDYLAYSILDCIVDHYFVVIEDIAEFIDNLEEKLFKHSEPKDMHNIHRLKRVIIYLRKLIAPVRELINSLLRLEGHRMSREMQFYLRDLYDHTVRVLESIEALRDTLSTLLEVYLSSLSNKMNEIMKILTIFTSMFIPLTFIAGVYGMNFKYMPEIDWKWSYPVFWIINLLIVLTLFNFFRKKQWI